MALIDWDEKYNIPHPVINEQHLHLVSLINRLFEQMRARQGKGELEALFGELVVYARTHFQQEEAIMKGIAFSGLAVHLKEHREFVNKVLEWRKLFEGKKASIDIEVLTYLKKWLMGHILDLDQQYAAQLPKPPG